MSKPTENLENIFSSREKFFNNSKAEKKLLEKFLERFWKAPEKSSIFKKNFGILKKFRKSFKKI